MFAFFHGPLARYWQKLAATVLSMMVVMTSLTLTLTFSTPGMGGVKPAGGHGGQRGQRQHEPRRQAVEPHADLTGDDGAEQELAPRRRR